MSLDQLESKLMALPRDERRAFARWFYDHEHEFIDQESDPDLSAEVLAELDRRRDELRANPSLAVPVTDEWFERLKQKLMHARAPEASAP